MPYMYDLGFPVEDGWDPCLLPCDHCGYPEPRDLGPILVLQGIPDDGSDPEWRGGYRLLACPHCGLTSFGELTP